MAVTRWHTLREGDTLTLARHLPARFDLSVETHLPRVRPLRLAHQVRQDMWRALQTLRGFSPVVRICTLEERVHIQAGGRVLGAVPPSAKARLAAVLEDSSNRARWIRHAREDVT